MIERTAELSHPKQPKNVFTITVQHYHVFLGSELRLWIGAELCSSRSGVDSGRELRDNPKIYRYTLC